MAAFDYDVFLSFAARDLAIVKPVWQRLTLSGLRVFWSDETLKQSAGRSFVSAIQNALETSKDFVLCWSANAAESPWVEEEYQAFYSQFYVRAKATRRLILFSTDAESVSKVPALLRHLQAVRTVDDLVQCLGGVDIAELQARNADLRRTIDQLRAENRDLAARRSTVQPATSVPEPTTAAKAEQRPSVAPAPSTPRPTIKEDAFLVKDATGYEHFVKTGLHVKWGPMYHGSGLHMACYVRTGALTKTYYFSQMSSLSMSVTEETLVIRFHLPERTDEFVGAIDIHPDHRKYAPELHLNTLDGDSAIIPVSEVNWPIVRVAADRK